MDIAWNTKVSNSSGGTNLSIGGYYDSLGVWHPYEYNYYWSVSSPIYLYQIFCPKKGCNTVNWLKLDAITPCTKCKAKLKAVSEQADYEIAIS